jgi:VCBS repeat-containing protein
MTVAIPRILAFSPDSGTPGDGITDSNIITLTGNAAANTTVQVYDGLTLLGTASVNANGVWNYTIPTASPLADGLHTFTVKDTDGTNTSVASAPVAVTVVPNINESTFTEQSSSTISVDGMNFSPQNQTYQQPSATWPLTSPNDHTLQFQLQPNDSWFGTHRSEVAGPLIPAGQTVNVSYNFQVASGSTPQTWTVLGQFHTDDNAPTPTPDYPVFAVELANSTGGGAGNYLTIDAEYLQAGHTAPTDLILYVSPTPIVRGQSYSVQVTANFSDNANGFLEVWINGSQVVDYHGPLGYGHGIYWKEGVYRGWDNVTMTASYSNLDITTTPRAPVELYDTVNGRVVTLNGTAQANSTVKIYDGATLLGSTTATGSGAWTYQTTTLSYGLHNFTATATDSTSHTSPASQAQNVVLTPIADNFQNNNLSDLLMSNSNTGAVVVGWVQNGQETYQQISGLGSEWQFGGTGQFTGNGDTDFLLRNSINGALLLGDVHNGSTTYTAIGGLGSEWNFIGDGYFLNNGNADFLLWNSNNGAIVAGDVVNGAAQYVQIGGVGSEWQFLGTGDFIGDGHNDFLMRSSNTGALAIGEVINSTVTYSAIGGVGSEWQFEGVGNFLGNSRTDFLMRNSNTGALVVGDDNGGIAAYTQIGGVGSEWQFVGTGNYLGAGNTDFLMRNVTNGALVVGAVNNNQAQYTAVGGVGPEWTFHS